MDDVRVFYGLATVFPERLADPWLLGGVMGAWIAAHDRGDTEAQETAARVITEASDWPTLVATDGGGVTDVMRAYAKRIAAGDSDAAQAMAQFEGAPGWDGTDRSALGAEIYDEVLGDKP